MINEDRYLCKNGLKKLFLWNFKSIDS